MGERAHCLGGARMHTVNEIGSFGTGLRCIAGCSERVGCTDRDAAVTKTSEVASPRRIESTTSQHVL
jgi:hypothetical protein